MHKLALIFVLLLSLPTYAIETINCSTCNTAHSAGLAGASDLWNKAGFSAGEVDGSWSQFSDKIMVLDPVAKMKYIVNLENAYLAQTITFLWLSSAIRDPTQTIIQSNSLDGTQACKVKMPNFTISSLAAEYVREATAEEWGNGQQRAY